MGNTALDARLLSAEEPSAIQPQRQSLTPPPVRARRSPVPTGDHLEAPWLRTIPCAACTRIRGLLDPTVLTAMHQ